MKTMICLALLSVSALTPFVAKSQDHGLSDTDRAAIRDAAKAWVVAANAKDFQALADTYTEDALLLPTNATIVRGRDAIGAMFESFPPFSDMAAKVVEIDGRGDLAYVRGTYSMKIEVPGASDMVEDRGKYIEIWRKQSDGGWKISRDIYNSDLPAEH